LLISLGFGLELCLQGFEAGSCFVDVIISLKIALFTDDDMSEMIFEHTLRAESLLVRHAVEITKVSGMLCTEIGYLQAID